MTTALVRPILVAAVLATTAQPAPAQDTRHPELSTPASETSYGCLVCHADKRRAFVQGVHSEWGIRCHDCHGGNPDVLEVEPAHAGEFVGAPDKLQTVEICSSCHADPDQMRQYGLPADQFAELRTSRHGQLLEAGNQDAPTCSDCHDPHTTLPSSDARSATFPKNIPDTCGRCHTDAEMMEPYGLGIGQLEEFRHSSHGRAIYEEDNFASPSCIGCHGSHAALPPDVREITNVCGRCHIDVRRALVSGPHGETTETGTVVLGCTTCHTNHGTERVDSEAIAETCTNCHAEGDAAAQVGEEVEEGVVRAEREMESAREAISELVLAGRQTSDARFRYRNALTEFRQIAKVHHSLDAERLTDLELRVSSIANGIEATAEVAAEERWEHRLLLIPLWFFALSIAVLAHFRLRRA
jgi:hypothetical protein